MPQHCSCEPLAFFGRDRSGSVRPGRTIAFRELDCSECTQLGHQGPGQGFGMLGRRSLACVGPSFGTQQSRQVVGARLHVGDVLTDDHASKNHLRGNRVRVISSADDAAGEYAPQPVGAQLPGAGRGHQPPGGSTQQTHPHEQASEHENLLRVEFTTDMGGTLVRGKTVDAMVATSSSGK